jgi:hypothetical protein
VLAYLLPDARIVLADLHQPDDKIPREQMEEIS